MLTEICKNFSGRRIVVVGDAVADQFLKGSISRVSREAPVFIMRHEDTVTLPGGAANAAANVAALGGSAKLFGFVGSDRNADPLRKSLTRAGVDTTGLVLAEGYTTTTKVRVLAGHRFAIRQQVIRIDYEPSASVGVDASNALSSALKEEAATADGIIVSDYGYGTVTPEIFELMRDISKERQIPLVVDSREGLEHFRGATSATPNRDEVEQILGTDCSDDQCEELRTRLDLNALLVTNGGHGMTLFEAGRAPFAMPVIGSPDAIDVTGAGDTVIAAYTMALASGASYRDAAAIANHAGGIVVMKKGTATASQQELLSSLDGLAPEALGKTN